MTTLRGRPLESGNVVPPPPQSGWITLNFILGIFSKMFSFSGSALPLPPPHSSIQHLSKESRLSIVIANF